MTSSVTVTATATSRAAFKVACLAGKVKNSALDTAAKFQQGVSKERDAVDSREEMTVAELAGRVARKADVMAGKLVDATV
jgi:hypothetical protein